MVYYIPGTEMPLRHKYKSRIYLRPDAKSTTLVADSQNVVEMTTFLENGEILLKIKNRFLLFTSTGDFTDEIEFKDLKDEQDKKRRKAIERAKKPFTNCKLEFNTEIKTADENEEG